MSLFFAQVGDIETAKFHIFQRHSHPEYDCERPLSEVNSELSYDALSDKQFKSSNDIHYSNARIYGDHDGSGSSQRGSMMSSENSDSGRMISGGRRNLPKQQRPLTRYLPIMSADLDLRLHIESAGHQVTLCPHVKVDSYSCRGYVDHFTIRINSYFVINVFS